MRKFLVFSCDDSLTSIGGPEEQKAIFGLQPLMITGGVRHIGYYLQQLIQKQQKTEKHELFGELPASEVEWVLNDRAKELGLTGIIIDGLSFLGRQTRDAIMAEKNLKSLDKQGWGLYGDSFMRFVTMLWRARFPVICTVHLDRVQDENGCPIDYPLIKGASQQEISGYFDVIAFTKVDQDASGNVSYAWQVGPDQRRPIAKDRMGVLGASIVPQNLDPILTGYEQRGVKHPKILIIGEPGQGKTTSLRTINPIPQPEEEEEV